MIKNTMNCILASSCELRLGTEILVPGFYLTCQPGYHNPRRGALASERLRDAFWSRGFSPHPGKLRGTTPLPTAGTDQRDIDARGCVVGERVAGEVGGLVGIRHDAQHSKGHIG